MINQILNEAYNNNIQLEVKNDKLSLVYKEGELPELLKNSIKKYKKTIIRRLRENELARKKGFLIYNNGELYEYRYGLGAYLYIERHLDDQATAWRANYPKDSPKPYRIIYLAKHAPFGKAFTKAVGFIDWLHRKERAN